LGDHRRPRFQRCPQQLTRHLLFSRIPRIETINEKVGIEQTTHRSTLVKLLPGPATTSRGFQGCGIGTISRLLSLARPIKGSEPTLHGIRMGFSSLPPPQVERRTSFFKNHVLPGQNPVRAGEVARQSDLILAGNFTHVFTFAKHADASSRYCTHRGSTHPFN